MKAGLCMSLLGFTVIGCAVGPDYVTPEVAAPKRWSEAKTAKAGDSTIYSNWWKTFNDPMLNGLINDAVHSNAWASPLPASRNPARRHSR